MFVTVWPITRSFNKSVFLESILSEIGSDRFFHKMQTRSWLPLQGLGSLLGTCGEAGQSLTMLFFGFANSAKARLVPRRTSAAGAPSTSKEAELTPMAHFAEERYCTHCTIEQACFG